MWVVDFGTERIDWIHFLTGCRKRQLNEAQYYPRFLLFFMFDRVDLIVLHYFYVCLFHLLIVLVYLSVLAK